MRSFLMMLGFWLLILGCSSKSTMKKYNHGTYEILLIDDNGFDSLSDMQNKAVNEAHDHCAKEGKKYVFVSQRVKPVRTAADSTEISLYFKCK